jgi:hypothetical protein
MSRGVQPPTTSASALKHSLSIADAALAAALAEQMALSQALDGLKCELADVDEKLPVLEIEKKSHALAKRYCSPFLNV